MTKYLLLFCGLLFSFELSAQVRLLSDAELAQAHPFLSIEEALSSSDTVFKLYLWEENRTTLSTEVAKIKTIQEIWLNDNPSLDLKDAINTLVKLPVLQTLNLSGNQIKVLPAEITKLAKLKDLALNGNSTFIDEMDASGQGLDLKENFKLLAQNPKLTKINLADNNITLIPNEIAGLKNLAILDLTNNQLATLPEAMGELSNLNELVLANNPIKELPEVLSKMKSLTKLDLRSIKLTNFMADMDKIKKMPKLKELWIPDGLTEADINALKKAMPKLEIISFE